MTSLTVSNRTVRASGLSRLLDTAERLLWDRQDCAMAAAGWQVTRRGRWHREYRHPALLSAAIAAARARNEESTRPQ